MFSLRNSGDSLAGEFSRLLKKTASVHVTPVELEAEDKADDGSGSNNADDMPPSPEDFLLTPEMSDEADSIDNALDSSIESFSSSSHKLMAGLGKIASDLRVKGEGFAADMVEATARSISKDLSKEAEEKAGVVKNLKKIASEFDASGDAFAGDMVRVTIKNIIDS